MYVSPLVTMAFNRALEDALRFERIANNPVTIERGKRDLFMDLAWQQFRLAAFIESN